MILSPSMRTCKPLSLAGALACRHGCLAFTLRAGRFLPLLALLLQTHHSLTFSPPIRPFTAGHHLSRRATFELPGAGRRLVAGLAFRQRAAMNAQGEGDRSAASPSEPLSSSVAATASAEAGKRDTKWEGAEEKLIVFENCSAAKVVGMRPGEVLTSKVFELSGHPWQLLLYPGGVDRERFGLASLGLGFVDQAPPGMGQGGAADGSEDVGIKGGRAQPPPGSGWGLSEKVNTVMKPSHSRRGRTAVYIRYAGADEDEDRFVDAVFSLQVVGHQASGPRCVFVTPSLPPSLSPFPRSPPPGPPLNPPLQNRSGPSFDVACYCGMRFVGLSPSTLNPQPSTLNPSFDVAFDCGMRFVGKARVNTADGRCNDWCYALNPLNPHP